VSSFLSSESQADEGSHIGEDLSAINKLAEHLPKAGAEQ